MFINTIIPFIENCLKNKLIEKNFISEIIEILVKSNGRGQCIGFQLEYLFKELINLKYQCEMMTTSQDRLNDKKYDLKIIVGDNEDFISLKSATQNIIQLTTDYKIRQWLDINYDINNHNMKNDFLFFLESNGSFTENIVFIFLLKTSDGVSIEVCYFDYKNFKEKFTTLSKCQGRIHTNFKLLDENNKEIGQIKYGTDKANAFQRGVWLKHNNNVFNTIYKKNNIKVDEYKSIFEQNKLNYGI